MQGSKPVECEVLNVIQAAGIWPDCDDKTQLLQAIQILSGGSGVSGIAAAAGYFSMMGQISASGETTLNIPEGSVNIGGTGKGFVIVAQPEFDVSDMANSDGSFEGLSLGDDIYIYAVDSGVTEAKLVASKNADMPNGFDAINSRKIGGFHYGRVRPIANRYDTDYVPTVQIVPNSVWDLQHRPTCDPTGMVEIVPGGFWADIYLNSEGGGTWPENIPVSRYGAAPIMDDVYARTDLHLLLRNAGKRLPTVEEFLTYAEGAPGGDDATNEYAWTATSNTAPASAGTVAKSVSMFNVVDTVGNLWDWIDNHMDFGGTATIDASVVNIGKDAAIPRGKTHHANWRCFAGGGRFDEGTACGSRGLGSNGYPWAMNGRIGLRGVCNAH
ncbi:hypothetical protein [Thalassospira sp.]|uniref:phage major tropism determinant n=1 Tax=Thalassospira sp. TaxID=1912094 RepID=UPI0026263E50|nr:hypothetical protein [Thalassospira sp.]MCH2277180.1 hypothetical protein [Thalassospira sp.]